MATYKNNPKKLALIGYIKCRQCKKWIIRPNPKHGINPFSRHTTSCVETQVKTQDVNVTLNASCLAEILAKCININGGDVNCNKIYDLMKKYESISNTTS